MLVIYIIIGLIVLSSLAYLTITGLKTLAKKNTHFTTLGNEQGKLIIKEHNIVDVLSRMEDVYYDKKGELQRIPNPDDYGSLFEELGIIPFGLTPIKEIYYFSAEWNEYVEKEAREITKGDPTYEIVRKKENIDYFKRFYSHAIQILRVEANDGSKIDLVSTVTFEILNIIQVIFKIKPDGIILAQAETAFAMAIQDEIRLLSYREFRDQTDKSKQDSNFVVNVLKKTNAIIEKKFHLRADIMEINFYDLSKGEPGDAELEKAQKAKVIAELEGDARVAKALKDALARKIEGSGEKEYFEEIAKIIGPDNIAAFANLEQVKNTQLLSYGAGSTPISPMVNIALQKKGERK